MSNRPNRWVPWLLAVLVVVVCYGLTMLSPFGACLALCIAAALRFAADHLQALEDDFREATTEVGFCNAARWMGMDPSDLGKTLKGEGGRTLDLRRIDMLPLPVQQRFYFLRCVRKGLPEFARTAAKMTLALASVKEIA